MTNGQQHSGSLSSAIRALQIRLCECLRQFDGHIGHGYNGFGVANVGMEIWFCNKEVMR